MTTTTSKQRATTSKPRHKPNRSHDPRNRRSDRGRGADEERLGSTPPPSCGESLSTFFHTHNRLTCGYANRRFGGPANSNPSAANNREALR